jgi:hypothetical protein
LGERKRAGFGESAKAAKAAKWANAFLLADLCAVGFVDTGPAASGAREFCRVGHSVAKRVFGDRSRKSMSGLELPCRCERRVRLMSHATGGTMVCRRCQEQRSRRRGMSFSP